MFVENTGTNTQLVEEPKSKNEQLKNDLLDAQQKVIELFERLNLQP
jgi:hypothetical protein